MCLSFNVDLGISSPVGILGVVVNLLVYAVHVIFAKDLIEAGLKASEKIAHYPGVCCSPTEARRTLLLVSKVDDNPAFCAE